MRFTAVTLAALAAVLANAQTEIDLPKVISMQVTNQSLVEHHTDHYRLEGGFAVRRGHGFYLLVETDKPISKHDVEFKLVNDAEESFNNPNFTTSVKKQLGENQYLLHVDLPVQSPMGRYQDISLTVASKHNRDYQTYDYPFPVYVLFNPWSKEDKWVYLPTEDLRQEHVLNEYGNVFQGSVGAYDGNKWYYGQGNQVTLDAVFHLLDKFLNRTKAADVLTVVQTLSRNQGMMHKKDGSVLVGSEDSLLEGNWGDFPFSEDNSPEIWTSATDILNRWKETGKPTKYGQCWVFGALQTTTMRAIGVGSRQVTAFGAMMDASMQRDKHHKNHHVADSFYDINGTVVYIESQAWNFHSWTDIYLNRQDLGELNEHLSGWQSLDGTPPGMIGPASVQAVKELTEQYPYSVGDLISTTHSTERTFLVECTPEHKRSDRMTGCHIQKLLKYSHAGLPLVVSSLPAQEEGGELGEKNITSEYINPATDAFIPFDPKDTKPLPGRRLRSAPRYLKADQEGVDAAKIVPKSLDVKVGESIEGRIDIETSAFKQDEFATVNMRFTLETRTGEEVKLLSQTSQRVILKGRMVQLPFTVDAASYLQKDLQDHYVRVVVQGVTESGQHFFTKEVLDIDSPEIKLSAPRTVEVDSKPFAVSAEFSNPLPFDLSKVCISLHSHIIDFVGQAPNVTSVQHCQELKKGNSIQIDASLVAPSQAGMYYLISSLQGDFLPIQQAFVPLHVVTSTAVEEFNPMESFPTSLA